MKKIIALLLALATLVALFGCSAKKEETSKETESVVETTTAAPETTTEETTTEPVTETTTEAPTTTKPTTQPKTEPTTKAKPECEHDYSGGVCTKCGKEHPEAEGIRKALKDSERYFTYLGLEGEILETRIEIYRSTKNPSYLVDIQDSVLKIDEYYSKARECLEPYKDTYLYVLYIHCEDEMPLVQSNSLAKASTYANFTAIAKELYDSDCERWGVE